MRGLTVVSPGPLATFQDFGRPGYAHLGVPVSGAADLGSLRQANRLVGNPESAVAIETTLGGWSARARGHVVLAVTGPATAVRIDGRVVGSHAAVRLPDGSLIEVPAPAHGCRNYVAARGGFVVPPILGSASTDTLSGLGPDPLRESEELHIGETALEWPPETVAPGPPAPGRYHELTIRRGPRYDDLADPAALSRITWTVNPASNRIGVRLDALDDALRHRAGLPAQPSEGVPLGAVQVPPSGQPVLFLADHPVTGGYPVAAVLTAESVDRAAQLVAGDTVRLHLA
ncbi:biotin-dependent carboxyltransferase family protein [Gordonia sp. (in: high G+C Gram-positive bacteria)]|uniref:5-oxoprolinase subunit C family protein n=1 Tax=Gordonia sp. (in: high G+C Gram-positive bacteria) TaxID=84139 RepID=UPI00262A85D4|nr:biotin-dependent carboxyltransferase family protein [Gordonia sp. (in: high G+C Gram-positive bacteria)]